MQKLQVIPQGKDNNVFRNGKRVARVILLLVLCFPSFAEPLKKHRRELPIPKKDKEAASVPEPKDPTERTAPRPQTLGNSPLKSPVGKTPSSNAGMPPRTETTSSSKCSEKYPIETFMQIAGAREPQASLRGGVYFLSDMRETPQVFLLETPGAWPEQLTFFPDGVRYFDVSPDGLKMLVATDEGGDEQFDIYLLQLRNKKTTPLLVGRKKRVESTHWDSKSLWFAYTSTERNQKDLDLYRFDLGTQKATLLTALEGHHEVSDISADGNRIALRSFRSVTDADVVLYSQKEKTLENLTQDLDSYAADPKFSASGTSIFFLSDQDSSTPQVFQIVLKSKTKAKPLTSGQWGVESILLSRDRDALYYTINEEGYSRLLGFEIDPQGQRKSPLPMPPLSEAVVDGFTVAGNYGKGSIFYSASSSQRSSDVWLWNKNTSIQWTHSPHGPMNKDCFLKGKLIHYPSFDKMEIPAFIFLPAGYSIENPGPIPFVVFIHGGPESQYRPSFSKTFQYFLQRGFGVFAPNIRGSIGYGRDYTLMDNYKKRMDSIQDIVEGARWLVKNQYTASKMLSIFGGSYGGFAVLRTIEVEPKIFAAASASVGISNFVTFLQNTKPYRRKLREAEYGPLTDEEFLKSISPIHFVEAIKTPLLIFHGANDPRVPISETEQIVEALKSRDIPVDFTVFKDEGHRNMKLSNIILQAKQMAFFFEKHGGTKTD